MVHSAVFHKHCVHLYSAFGWNCPHEIMNMGSAPAFMPMALWDRTCSWCWVQTGQHSSRWQQDRDRVGPSLYCSPKISWTWTELLYISGALNCSVMSLAMFNQKFNGDSCLIECRNGTGSASCFLLWYLYPCLSLDACLYRGKLRWNETWSVPSQACCYLNEDNTYFFS
jgi:hypothetical protein